MAEEEYEEVEVEVSEDDILYYLVDEDNNEIGFVIEEDGEEVQCFYEGYEFDDYELAEGVMTDEGEIVDFEISADEIKSYLFDEQGNEIGFVIEDEGVEYECYYENDDEDEEEAAEAPAETVEDADEAPVQEQPAKEPAKPYVAEKAENHGYLHKLAAIVGFKGRKARVAAEGKLDVVRDKAEVQVDKAKQVATEQASKAKEKAQENDLNITRESLKETTADLNAIAKEGAETAKELKEAYDDIMDNFGSLMPKKIRRKLP